MRPRGDIEAEAHVLTTEVGQILLAHVGQIARISASDLTRWRKDYTAEVVSAAVRLVDCRRRAATKFSRANAMWLEPVGLEQATSEIVATHKARRFEAGSLVVDLCSGIGGDAIALAEKSPVIAVDSNEAMGRRLMWNADVYGRADRVQTISSLAEDFVMPAQSFVHIDPDRRATTDRRAREVADYVPGLEFLHKMMKAVRGGAIKLGPGSDFSAHFSGQEVELVSLFGECREATIWFGELSTCLRRATILPAGLTWTNEDCAGRSTSGPLSAWLFDPDPSLTRSGLLDRFAAAHSLVRPFVGIDLLSSDQRVNTPWLQAFQVEEVLPFDMKILRQRVTKGGLGPLEIKPRGIPVSPEKLRRQLKPQGDRPATLFVIRASGGTTQVVLASREPSERV